MPETIDPDRWLERVNGEAFVRKVQSDASVRINHEQYDVPRELAGQQGTCFINAAEKQFEIWQAGSGVKSVPIKGLYGKTMPFDEYVGLMKQEARSEYRRYLHLQKHATLIQGRLWAEASRKARVREAEGGGIRSKKLVMMGRCALRMSP